MGFIVQQPNGLYCRFSTIVDCPTHINMTKQDYIDYMKEKAEKEAIDTLEHSLESYELIDEYFRPNNMTRKKFEKYKELMNQPADKVKMIKP